VKKNNLTNDSTPLTVSTLCTALAAAPDLPIVVVWPDGEPIEAHFHVTEVGRVQRDFVDCGGTVRQGVTCLLQTWVGEDVDHRLTGRSLLKALAHASPVLRGEDLPVELEYESCNVVQLRALSAVAEAGRLVIQLGPKHTDCLAREICVPASTGNVAADCC
jgi:Family of unknown function (DUF6428)